MEKYVLEVQCDAYAADMSFSLQDVLRYAQLPPDLFTRTPLLVVFQAMAWYRIRHER